MWTRTELKERAKEALKRNYWKAVLVTVLPLAMGVGASSTVAVGSHHAVNNEDTENIENEDVMISENEEDFLITEESEVVINDMMDEVEDSLQAAALVSDNNIMVCISKLRAKLSEDANAYIKTIRGLGYRLER